ncbi:MAG TPA: hypothetical protein VGM10_12405 [Actinocrinis sp.]|jgi:hypothetical protein
MAGLERFRVGDILTVSCPFTDARVGTVRPPHLMIKWPWHRVEPDAPRFRWNGEVAIDTHHASRRLR